MLGAQLGLGLRLRCTLRPSSDVALATPACRRPSQLHATAVTIAGQTLGCGIQVGVRRRAAPAPHVTASATTTSFGGAADSAAATEPSDMLHVSEVARENLRKAANACRRYGWISFWTQLVLTTVAAVILLFSMAFTAQNSPSISLYLTLFGIIMGFLSTFWSFGYTRLSFKLKAFLEAGSLETAPKIRRTDVINMLEKGAIINVLGASATLLGLQATIGLLVAKTLTSATVNPFMAPNSSAWNPVLAFDVFNVQATTNALLSHFVSLILSLWLLRVIANRPSAASVIAKPTSR